MKKYFPIASLVLAAILVLALAITVYAQSVSSESATTEAPVEASGEDDPYEPGDGQYHRIDAEEALSRLQDNAYALIVDVRTLEEYDENHVVGAYNLPVEQIGDAHPELLPYLNQEILVYCRSGNRSKTAAEKLLKLGYTNVYDFGGIKDWPYDTMSTEEEDAYWASVETEEDTHDHESEDSEALLGSFTTTDLDGYPVDAGIFKGYKLTMMNIWATYCPSCLQEMPDLGKLAAEYKEQGVQILGLVSDTADYDGVISAEQTELAKEIVEKTQAAYTHLQPSEDLINTLLWQVSAVPTTIFLDENGDLVDNAYIGARSYEEWAQIIQTNLE